MGGREDAGDSSSGEGEKNNKMKRTRSQSDDDGASSSKSSAHKKKKEEQHSRSDGDKRYVCVQASLCAGGWRLGQCMPVAAPIPFIIKPCTRLRPPFHCI